jgi:UDP-N-acetylglucosamine transferase subunit ALG13
LSTFVSVGNATQPFDRLLRAVCANLGSLSAPVFVQSGSTRFDCGGTQAAAFVAMDEFERRVAEATLVVMHAGAGAVIHAVRAGKVPVVMPRRTGYGEHVDDHQIEFGSKLAQAGLVVMAQEPEDLARAIGAALELQRTRQARTQLPLMLQLVAETLRKYAAESKA